MGLSQFSRKRSDGDQLPGFSILGDDVCHRHSEADGQSRVLRVIIGQITSDLELERGTRRDDHRLVENEGANLRIDRRLFQLVEGRQGEQLAGSDLRLWCHGGVEVNPRDFHVPSTVSEECEAHYRDVDPADEEAVHGVEEHRQACPDTAVHPRSVCATADRVVRGRGTVVFRARIIVAAVVARDTVDNTSAISVAVAPLAPVEISVEARRPGMQIDPVPRVLTHWSTSCALPEESIAPKVLGGTVGVGRAEVLLGADPALAPATIAGRAIHHRDVVAAASVAVAEHARAGVLAPHVDAFQILLARRHPRTGRTRVLRSPALRCGMDAAGDHSVDLTAVEHGFTRTVIRVNATGIAACAVGAVLIHSALGVLTPRLTDVVDALPRGAFAPLETVDRTPAPAALTTVLIREALRLDAPPFRGADLPHVALRVRRADLLDGDGVALLAPAGGREETEEQDEADERKDRTSLHGISLRVKAGREDGKRRISSVPSFPHHKTPKYPV